MTPAILSWSDNLRAETLFRCLGYEKRGLADRAQAADAASALLADLVGKQDAAGAAFVDGSGLSADNRLSSRQLVGVLQWLRREHGGLLARSLAISGERGTLTGVLNSEPLKGRVVAKTGTIRGAKCLSGFLTTDGDEELCFSFLCENPDAATVMWPIFEQALKILSDWEK